MNRKNQMIENFKTEFERCFQTTEKVKCCGELIIDEKDLRKIDKWIKEDAVIAFLIKFLDSPLTSRLIFFFFYNKLIINKFFLKQYSSNTQKSY